MLYQVHLAMSGICIALVHWRLKGNYWFVTDLLCLLVTYDVLYKKIEGNKNPENGHIWYMYKYPAPSRNMDSLCVIIIYNLQITLFYSRYNIMQ
jgi:hypothetical protein